MTDLITNTLEVNSEGIETYNIRENILGTLKIDDSIVPGSIEEISKDDTKLMITFKSKKEWIATLKTISSRELNKNMLFTMKCDGRGEKMIYEIRNGKIINEEDLSSNEFK